MNIEESINLLEWANLNKLYIETYYECDYHNIYKAIETLLTAYEKEKENNKELRKYYATRKEVEELKEKNEFLNWYFENQKENFVHKDKIKEILGIEEEIDTEKILSLLQTIVDENARLEDIEDRKVQVDYERVFNKGVKSVENKIKAKVIEVKDRPVKDEFITASQGKLNTIIDIESLLD